MGPELLRTAVVEALGNPFPAAQFGDAVLGSDHDWGNAAFHTTVLKTVRAGYPLSEEQIAAIRSVTASGGRVAIIEGAAGSGKTTTLRPIADLYREHGSDIIATAVAWRTAVARY